MGPLSEKMEEKDRGASRGESSGTPGEEEGNSQRGEKDIKEIVIKKDEAERGRKRDILFN